MPDEYVVLYHPPTNVTHTFTKAREPLKRRDGWVGAEEINTSGTVDEVLEWVGGDPHRAASAKQSEQSRPDPRSTLIQALDRIVNEEE